MNEEIMNNEIELEEIENTEVETETTSVPEEESDGNGLVGLIVTGIVIATGVILWKSKDKISAWKDKRAIKRLEKRGYVVEDPEEEIPEDEVDEEVVVDEE